MQFTKMNIKIIKVRHPKVKLIIYKIKNIQKIAIEATKIKDIKITTY